MIVALLVVGGLSVPVTGLLIGPDGYGGRHGLDMFIYLGRFVWYGYTAVAVAVLATVLIALRRGNSRLATGAAKVLSRLTVLFGSIYLVLVTAGVFQSDGKPWHAAVAAVVGVGAVVAVAYARDWLRYIGRAP